MYLLVLELFLLMVANRIMSTLQTIFLYKGHNFLPAMFNSFGTFLYLLVVVELTKVNNLSVTVLVCLAAFVGSFLPSLIVQKFERDRVFVFDITPDKNESGEKFVSQVKEAGLPFVAFDGHTRKQDEVVCCKIFSQSKNDSRKIARMIPDTFKYHVVETQTFSSN